MKEECRDDVRAGRWGWRDEENCGSRRERAEGLITTEAGVRVNLRNAGAK